MAKQRKLNTRDTFLRGMKLNVQEVELDGGVTVFIRELSGKALLDYNQKIAELETNGEELTPANSLELVSLLVSKSVCDEEGNLLLDDSDMSLLQDFSMNVLSGLSQKILEVSGMNKAKIDEVKSQLGNVEKPSGMEG